jgi:hypothetical protein
MDAHRLVRDELLYEMRVRGLSDLSHETVSTLRRKLSELLRTEAFGVLVTHDSFEPDLVVETQTCVEKVTQLSEFLSGRTAIVKGSNDERIVETRMKHLYGRVARVQKVIDASHTRNPVVTDSVQSILHQLGVLESVLDTKIQDQTPVAEPPAASSTLVGAVMLHKQQIPVCKWGITFSGKVSEMSVNSFLERVEEYRVARGVSTHELLVSAVDLLEGPALIWYRSVRSTVHSWEEFVRLIRLEYLPFDYEHELWSEIRHRVQGAEESVGAYFACMINLFNRLPVRPSEAERLNILRRNLLPYFIHGIGLIDIETVSQLMATCKKLEVTKSLATASRAANPKASLLEPDLADDTSVRPKPVRKSVAAVSCWNCQHTGHVFAQCSEPRRRTFCFRCGKPDVTKNSCECRKKKSVSENPERNP